MQLTHLKDIPALKLHALAIGIPIGSMVGDQQAALVGHLECFNPGGVKNTYGTGCFMVLNTGEKVVHSKHGLISTVAYQIETADRIQPLTHYALEGSIAIAGASIQWLRDKLNLISNPQELNQLALSVEDTGGLYFVPAFTGLFAPYWKPDARGIMIGLTQYVTKAHICRALFEAVSFQTREIVEVMEQDAQISIESLNVDGGITNSPALMEIQSGILGRTLRRPLMRETTALGAAILAGISLGICKLTDSAIPDSANGKRKISDATLEVVFASTEECLIGPDGIETFEPSLDDQGSQFPDFDVYITHALIARDKKFRIWKKAVERTFEWDSIINNGA